MATYTIKLDERTTTGKALKEYLQSLGVLAKRISSSTKDEQEADEVAYSSELITKEELVAIQKGLEDIKNGRTTKIKDVNNIWESIL